jgi:hypothetical protein
MDLAHPVGTRAIGWRLPLNSHGAAFTDRHEKVMLGILSDALAAHRTLRDAEHNVTSVLPEHLSPSRDCWRRT